MTGDYIALNNARPQFTETEILIAVMDGNRERAEELIADMLPVEALRFVRQLRGTAELVRRRLEAS